MKFRPFIGLTIFTVISLAILITLGTWQYHRLQWKTALLAEVEVAANAPAFGAISDIGKALEAGEPIDFRRISIITNISSQQTPYFVYFRGRDQLAWRPFVEAQQFGRGAYVALGPVLDDVKTAYEVEAKTDAILTGYVRLARPVGKLAPDSTPSENRWFGFNPMPETAPWQASDERVKMDLRFYLDVVPGALMADDLPVKRPDIRNNHFDYMLTWYGLALALFVIYVILHLQNGRLSFGARSSET